MTLRWSSSTQTHPRALKTLKCTLLFLRKHPPTEILDENSTLCKSAESEVLSSLDKMDLLKQIHLLKEPGREVIHLRLYGNLSYAEIGEIMGKSENWARVTFYRAKEQLRKELQNDK